MDHALTPLKATMPHHVEKITRSFYGLNFYSRLPLSHPEIRFLANQTRRRWSRQSPSRWQQHRLHWHSPEAAPALASRPRARRRALRGCLSFAGPKAARHHAGDLNSTPWEEAVGRSRRIARLIDPRRGYGYVPTFNAKLWFESWPLDHVFHEGGFATVSLKRLGAFGSDHYPYVVRLCRTDEGEAPLAQRPDDVVRAKSIIARANATKPP